MHLRLSPKMEEKLSAWRLKYLPRTLFFRTMLLIFVPLVAVQIVSVVVFFDGSWSRMGRRLSDTLASDMAVIVDLIQNKMITQEQAKQYAKHFWDVDIDYENLSNDMGLDYKEDGSNRIILGFFEDALSRLFPKDK